MPESPIIPAMTETIERLLAVQDRDQRIRSLKAELLALPAEKAAREKQLADAAARLEAAKTRLRQIEVEKKTLELEAQTKRGNIDRYRNQQLQTRKNEEYTALTHEIQLSEKAIEKIEDRELELMEEVENLKPDIEKAETEHKAEKTRIDQAIAILGDKKVNLEKQIAELEGSRQSLVDGIDEDLIDTYNRLFKSKHGTAVVALEENEVCTGCHMKVTTQTSVQVKADKALVNCPNCGRLLFIPA